MMAASGLAAEFEIARTSVSQEATPSVDAAISKIEIESRGKSGDSLEAAYIETKGAVDALMRAGPKAIDRIERSLKNPSEDWSTKAILCKALGGIKGTRSAQALMKVLSDRSQSEVVRGLAGQGLADNQTPEAVRMIERVVEDERVPLKIRVAIMTEIGVVGMDDIDWLKRVALGQTITKSAGLNLDEGTGIMWNAMRALGFSRNPKATDALIELQQKFPTNGVLTEALRRRHDAMAIPVLIQVLQTPGLRVSMSRDDAAHALGELKASEAVPTLIDLAEHSSDAILVSNCAEALGDIGDKKAIPALEKLLGNVDRDPRLKGYGEQDKAGVGVIPPIREALHRLKGNE